MAHILNMRMFYCFLLGMLISSVSSYTFANNESIISSPDNRSEKETESLSEEEQEWNRLRRIVHNSTYTSVQKQELHEKARGVEKLLRTPVELRNYLRNEQAWTEEDFFCRYTRALHEDMERFIAETLLSDVYLEDYGKEQAEKDAAECRRCVDELAKCARTAYQASLNWFARDVIHNRMYEDRSELYLCFRMYLQNRLLMDLCAMQQNEGNWWVSGINVNHTQGRLPNNSSITTEFEDALNSRYWDTFSKRTVDAWLHHIEEETLEQYRQFIVRFIYNKEAEKPHHCPEKQEYQGMGQILMKLFFGSEPTSSNSPLPEKENREEEIALFIKAETAWDAYMEALNNANRPIENWYFSGSCVSGWRAAFNESTIRSQESYLLYIIRFANNGNFPYTEPVDFTRYEMTEEAADASNKLPG